MFLEGVCPIKPSLFIASAHYSYFLHEYSCGAASLIKDRKIGLYLYIHGRVIME